mgnify:CR=1
MLIYILAILFGLSLGLNGALGALLRTRTHPVRQHARIDQLIAEGVRLAEQSKLKGPDRFRIARNYVEQRAQVKRIKVDARDLALRIESAVTHQKG